MPTARGRTRPPRSIDGRRVTSTPGDAGHLRRRTGSVKIIDRAKDVGKLTTSGALFAPNYVENKLKFFPHIKEAVAFGQSAATRVCAFINIDMSARWATGPSGAASPYSGLHRPRRARPEVCRAGSRAASSRSTPSWRSDAALRGRRRCSRFLVLHKELDPDDDEFDAHAQGAPRASSRRSTRC